VHGGGSCQASISEDGGKTFRVVKSYVGGCPEVGKVFEFVVPKETKSGVVLFAWLVSPSLNHFKSLTFANLDGAGLGSIPLAIEKCT